ncbi:MAG: hypothetical protein NTV54_15590 [Ignavibacteriales bacterium]|nr:hypothetical protein [Ignavibacteriales bacterium]
MTLLLLGESEKLTVSADYEIKRNGEGLFVILHRAETNRPWLNNLIADYVLEKTHPIPGWLEKLLKAI